jgi:hypothetical protein
MKMIIVMFLHFVSDLALLCQLSTKDLLEKVLRDPRTGYGSVSWILYGTYASLLIEATDQKKVENAVELVESIDTFPMEGLFLPISKVA